MISVVPLIHCPCERLLPQEDMLFVYSAGGVTDFTHYTFGRSLVKMILKTVEVSMNQIVGTKPNYANFIEHYRSQQERQGHQ